MKGECKGLETSWFSSSQRQNSCAWVAKLWSLWNYKIKKRFEPAGLSPENNFSYQPETCKTGHESGPQTRPTCMAARKFSIKILNRQSFVGKLHTALRREFRWRFGQKSNWTDGKRSKISTYFVRSALWMCQPRAQLTWRSNGRESASSTARTKSRLVLVVGSVFFIFHRSVFNSWNSQFIRFILCGIVGGISAEWSRDW